MSVEGERLIYHALVKVETSCQDTTPECPSCVDSVVMHRKVQRHRTTVERGSFGVRTRVLRKNSKPLYAVPSPALPICLVPNLLSLCAPTHLPTAYHRQDWCRRHPGTSKDSV